MRNPKIFHQGLALATFLLLAFPSLAFAESGDLYIATGGVWFSDATIVHNETVRIYATVTNDGTDDLLGSVQFVNQTTGKQIGSDQSISVLTEQTDTVFVDWRPTAGTYTISVVIYPWDASNDDASNNTSYISTTVDYDNDLDGVGNASDPDDDNDDVPDTEDLFPYDKNESKDTDGDGLGDNADTDDDNDGILDPEDSLPQDPTESVDTDSDGIGNNADTDNDNDGLIDTYETSAVDPETLEPKDITDPLVADTDGDATLDGQDAFPLDPTEWTDTDEDKTGNNADPDDEDDGLLDLEDPYPENHGPVILFSQYEETYEAYEDGGSMLVLDASQTYDPDGTAEGLTYQWLSDTGLILGDTPVFEIVLPQETPIYPATLVVTDDTGESRTLELEKFGVNEYLKDMILTLAIALSIPLAILGYLKYTASARKNAKRFFSPLSRSPSKKSSKHSKKQ